MKILITGASRGIGAELALQLAAEAQQLILVARSEERLMEVADQCNAIGGQGTATALVFDLAGILKDPSGFASLLAAQTDALDVVFNNAGLLVNKPFGQLTTEDERRVFDVNYFVPAQLIRICLPFLQRSPGASVINVTTMGAVQGSAKFPGLSAYSSSKGALAILTECLAEEFKPLISRSMHLHSERCRRKCSRKHFQECRRAPVPGRWAVSVNGLCWRAGGG